VSLLQKYPVVWHGHLSLKNEQASIQLHFLSGELINVVISAISV
jgi:hypothetical protein